ncbi:MAG: Tim44-like domain-containing protein [Agitococcus sp.]|nr:Tim44-like domain-containing protein [Agitococcus sp.]
MAAAAVGVAAGYALGHSNSTPQAGHPAPVPSVESGAGQVVANSQPAPPQYNTAAVPPPASSIGISFSTLFILLALGAGGYYAYRKYGQRHWVNGQLVQTTPFPSSSAPITLPKQDPMPFQELRAQAKDLFSTMQDLNNQRNLPELALRTTPNMYQRMKADIDARTLPSHTTVVTLDAKVLDYTTESTRMVASVHYQGWLTENTGDPAEEINEVWHFVKDSTGQRWLIAGIEQV